MDGAQTQKIIAEIEQVVTDMFEQHTPAYLLYHNIDHTKAVVAHATEIAAVYELSVSDRFVLLAAAWFHDTGQLFTTPEWHEAESVKIANTFFHGLTSIPVYLVTAIDLCILATKMPQRPNNLLEEILCDADLYHLGTDAFLKIDQLVREEAGMRGLHIDHWDQGTIRLMLAHHYHTSYCQEKLTAVKEKNLISLMKRQA